MRGWRVFFQLHNQLAGDLNSQLAGGSFDVRPSHFGVGAEGLAFDEGDLTMPQLKQVLEGKLGGSLMVQDDVGHALYVVVARYRDHGHRKGEIPRCVDGDQAIDGSFEKEPGVLINEVWTVAVAGDKIEVSFFQKIVFHSTHHRSGIPIADFRDNDSDGEAALGPQRSSEYIWPVFELAGCGKNPVLGLLGNSIRDRRAVDDQRHGCGRKPKVVRELLQTHGFVARACRLARTPARVFCSHAAQSRTSRIAGQAQDRKIRLIGWY